MIKTFHVSRVVAGVLVFGSFFFVQYTQAIESDESCGSFITIDAGVQNLDPISDCNFPFGPTNSDPPFQISFSNTQIADGGVYAIAGSSGSLDIPELPHFSFSRLYKHQGSDYLLIASNNEPFTFTAGTYSLYITGGTPLMQTQNIPQKLFAYIVQTAHAQTGPPSNTLITFTVTDPVPVEPIVDELILKYAPILYFHPQEDYFPMDVDIFVEASSLWKKKAGGDDVLVTPTGSLTIDTFEAMLATGVDTDDMYLAFSSPSTARTIDLQRARSTYAAMDVKQPTIYYHKMTDTTDYGKTFTVLQYWYFYAMNNWGEKDGYNDHEGDWESTFVFLNEDEEPEYVAYSSHLNDGLPQFLNGQYSSVRREWQSEDVRKAGNRVASYISLGSHANYFNIGDYQIFPKTPFTNEIVDKTSDSGTVTYPNQLNLVSISPQVWSEYRGLFGSFTDKQGFNGPQGPTHINVTGQTRFSEPIEWAGLNNYYKKVVVETTDTVEDTKQGIKMVFDVALKIGTIVTVQLHNEMIAFGNNVIALNPLPIFWDITASLENDTFSTILILSYSDEAVEAVGGNEEDIVMVYYNPETNSLEPLESIVDTLTNTVSATTTHFSRFLLGFEEAEVAEVVPVEAITPAIQTANRYKASIQRPEPKVLGVSTTTTQGQVEQLREIVDIVTILSSRKEEMSEQQKALLRSILVEIQEILKGI